MAASAAGTLLIESVLVYLLVLFSHSLRHRAGLGPFYALLGGLTAIMSWVTDAGVQVEVGSITFMVGSTVFYTALLLGVFVVYIFDGPRPTRMAILTIAAVSILTPVTAAVLHAQMTALSHVSAQYIPIPSLRINTASVTTTIADLIFLAIAWEFLGKPKLKMNTWPRVYLTLLGVLLLDVVLFSTGAFAGTPYYLSIMSGTLFNRLAISIIAGPILFLYVEWQNRANGVVIENRPVLAILREVTEIRAELGAARQEIERRARAEERLAHAHGELQNLTTRLRVVREQERAEVGWELHDEVGQTLSVVKMDLNSLRKMLPNENSEPARAVIGRMDTMLDGTIARLRRLFMDLRPEMLNDLGLTAAIEWQAVEGARRAGINCHVGRLDGVTLPDEDTGLIVYRVFQEALDNALRHSGATEVEVSVEQHNDHVTVNLRDNGCGISEEGLLSPSSLGLVDMRQWLRPQGGEVEIESTPGKGTAVHITVPAT